MFSKRNMKTLIYALSMMCLLFILTKVSVSSQDEPEPVEVQPADTTVLTDTEPNLRAGISRALDSISVEAAEKLASVATTEAIMVTSANPVVTDDEDSLPAEKEANLMYDEPEPEVIEDFIGQDDFEFQGHSFHRYELPDVYYPGINFSYFQPTEPYKGITDKSSPAYKVVHSINAYEDWNGFLRYYRAEDDFKIDGKDDYVVALGTYYKPKGECGQRYLVVTSTGMYTMIAGDEKQNRHTDSMNMFGYHGNNKQYAGVIEFMVNNNNLPESIRDNGTVTVGPIEEFHGDILYIYGID